MCQSKNIWIFPWWLIFTVAHILLNLLCGHHPHPVLFFNNPFSLIFFNTIRAPSLQFNSSSLWSSFFHLSWLPQFLSNFFPQILPPWTNPPLLLPTSPRRNPYSCTTSWLCVFLFWNCPWLKTRLLLQMLLEYNTRVSFGKDILRQTEYWVTHIKSQLWIETI